MKEMYSYLENLLNDFDTVVMATSGGPDSMALLYALVTIKNHKKIKVICCHVNHGVRKESENEAIFVKDFCLKYNIPFEYMIIKGYKNGKFSESEGRSKRYAFFEETIKKYKANYLFTAHHGDDLIETILMKIVRGSNLKGYIGIPREIIKDNYKIVRPLLNVSKDEILEYLDSNKIKYVKDLSNEEENYTRNRYRKHLLPFLKKEEKNVHLKFLKYSESLEEVNNYIESIVSSKKNKIYKDNIVDLKILKKEDIFIQKEIIKKIIEIIQMDNIFNIDDNKFQSIMNLINSNNNVRVTLDNGFIFRKSYDKLYIEKENNEEIKDYEYILDKDIKVKDFNFKFLKSSNIKSNNIIRINSEEVSLPLIVRNKKDGDKIKVKNLNGTKKVKDIFIDNKIDIYKRCDYPIVMDSKNNIIWIPGIKKSTFDKEIFEKYDIIIKCVEGKNEK